MDTFPRRKPRPPTTRREAKENQRWRVLEAMGHLVGRRGYAETSIAQVIARAGVSRKAFYEYFADKDACYLAAYEALSDRFIRALEAEPDARAKLKQYLAVLESDLPLARAFIVETLGAGPAALAMREEVNRRFGVLLLGGGARDALLRKAVTGGINDVVAGALMRGEKRLLRLLPGLLRFLQPFTASS